MIFLRKVDIMEIKDLLEYEINESSQTIKVTFRLLQDSEDEVRIDTIELEESEQYGYSFLDSNENKFKEIFLEEDEEDEFDFGDDDFLEESIDEQELISFLTEYYILNPKRLPDTEFF